MPSDNPSPGFSVKQKSNMEADAAGGCSAGPFHLAGEGLPHHFVNHQMGYLGTDRLKDLCKFPVLVLP